MSTGQFIVPESKKMLKESWNYDNSKGGPIDQPWENLNVK
jgi:hypothetical protein